MTSLRIPHAGPKAEQAFEAFLAHLRQAGAHTVACTSIDVARMPRIGFDDVDPDTIDKILAVKGNWFYVALQAGDDVVNALEESGQTVPEPVGFQLVTVRDGVAYEWTLAAEDYSETADRILEPLDAEEEGDAADEERRAAREEAEALITRDEKTFIEKTAAAMFESLPPDTLKVNVHNTVQTWFTTRGLQSYAFENREVGRRIGAAQPRVGQRLKAMVDERRHKVLAKAAEKFMTWYDGKNKPRYSKALVGVFAAEQGLGLPDDALSELKALIDVSRVERT